jgi:hypothetical protein
MRTEYDVVIRAWIDGAEVEQMHAEVNQGRWHPFDGYWMIHNKEWQYRLAKPAKEPKYLYVYTYDNDGVLIEAAPMPVERGTYLGKIRLEE